MKRTFTLIPALLLMPFLAYSADVSAGASVRVSADGPVPAYADADSVRTLESVSVHASRTAMSLGASARIVTVMDSVAIASIPAKTVNDLLKQIAGVDVRQRGPMGMQT
ncbi:MAG: hypothetical protein PUJ44_08770, partial [Bacteroidales bacterium]|nr:hypothetical protein [Bacteroidales bacterium]